MIEIRLKYRNTLQIRRRSGCGKVMGNTVEDVSAECKQQHGEKVIGKSLPGRAREREGSAPPAAFCRGVRRKRRDLQ